MDNYSLKLNHLNCKICGNEYISLLAVFAFAGIVLIVMLTGLHMTVATGTINGLILYVNIVGANKDIFFPNQPFNILTVFISWLNLDFGIESCLFHGLDFYTYVWLQYVFPLYLWCLMGIIILSSRRSAIMMRLLGSNPVAVLATLILLSYTKILQNVIMSLSFTELEYPDYTTQYVWMFDGNLGYFKGRHIYLAIFSIFTSAFIFVPFTFFLMFGYYLLAFSNRRCFTWLNRLKPLLDAYYGPYRKETRYWTGFLLFLRFCLYLTFALNGLRVDSINLLAILTAFAIIIAIPWVSRGGIYEKSYLDLLEASFILNICMLTTATYHTESVGGNQELVTYIFVGIAFAEFIGILIFHVFFQVSKWNFVRKCISRENGDERIPLTTDKSDFVHTREDDNRDV